MGDPLSIAASVAGLLSLGLQTTAYLYDYYNALRERNQDLARTAERLGGLLKSLRIINETVHKRQWHPNDKEILQNIERSIAGCEDIIHELADQVHKFKALPTGNLRQAISATTRRAIYPLRRSTLEKVSEEVDDFRENLSLALQALQLNDTQDVYNDLIEIKTLVQKAQALNISASVRQWLRGPDATIELNNACVKRHAKTGDWLTRSTPFTTWLNQNNSLLWLYGFAGCGKSVLCSTAIQQAFRHKRNQADSAVAFFFFIFNDESKQDSSAALRGLLLQLCGQVGGLEKDLSQLKDSSNDGTVSNPILIEYLRMAITKLREAYIFLDALDECPDGHRRAELLSMIDTMREWRLPALHLLVTSRDVQDIRDHMLSQQQIHAQTTTFVPLRDSGVDQDIQDYISYRVENDAQLRRWGNHCAYIKDHLTRNAGGVFRWVECQLNPLRKCARSKRHLNLCLNALPRSLDDTYERMLCDIGTESRDEARQILSLLCYSPRPLTVDELIEAVAVDVDGQQRYDPDRKLEDAEDLLRICPGLIEISQVGLSSYGTKSSDEAAEGLNRDERLIGNRLVRIAHFSVQEYLVSDRIVKSDAAFYALSEPMEVGKICELCLIYLLNEEFVTQKLTPQLLRQYTFARYAARYWYECYQQVQPSIDTELSDKLEALFTREHAFSRWVKLYDMDRPWVSVVEYDKLDQTHATPVYYASLLGLGNILERIIFALQADVNVEEGFYGTALRAASAKGHEQAVQILIDHGADITPSGSFWGSALQGASARGHEKVVQILLDNGLDINAEGGEYGSALQAASAGGYERVVQKLIEHGANVNAQGGEYGSALQVAAVAGYESIVRMLLDHGAVVNDDGQLWGSTLQAASARGYENVVQMLLDSGADVNADRGHYGSALQLASAEGHEKVVQMLVDSGADINSRGGEYGSALQAALARGHERVVQTLIEAGAR